jgi:putative tryptophan/tyrosine transport system substrate-binding protein
MRRRAFITLLGGAAAAAWPLAARAQQPLKAPTIGFLIGSTPAAVSPWTAAFVERLRELGWIEGRTIKIEYRWAEGDNERLPELAADLVRRKVDVILTAATPTTLAAKQATASIPIVFAGVGDPVSAGLVASLARPGGNVTGLSNQQNDAVTKRLELLRELVPGLRRIAIMANVTNPAAMLEINALHVAAYTLSLQATTLEIRRVEDIAPAFEGLRDRADALYVYFDSLVTNNRLRINIFALAARLPTISAFREFVVTGGGLASYGANTSDIFRRAGDYVDKILRGVMPAELPVEQPAKFDLVINLITAKALGLTISPMLLTRADEVIE